MQPPRSRLASALINAALVLGSVAFCLLATELFFRAYGAVHASAVAATPPPPSAVPPPDPGADIAVPASILLYAAQRHALLTLPAEWEMTQVTVPGASSAYTWQGVLHVMN